ncbi:MAG: 50S ribosomal protein L18 [Candidatus Njordarchaeota archaeon]
MRRKKYGKTYRVPWRRRREGKTDYHARYKMLLSGKTRAVVRKSLKHITVQFVTAEIGGDKTLSFTKSIELKKYGWEYNCGNIPAAYLTGFLAGLKAIKNNIDEAILDIGPQRSTRGSRIYAALKGIIDAGVSIPHNEKIFPPPERILGKHIEIFADKLKKNDKDYYKRQFGQYISKKIEPTKISEQFIKVIKNIVKDFNAKIPDWIGEVK